MFAGLCGYATLSCIAEGDAEHARHENKKEYVKASLVRVGAEISACVERHKSSDACHERCEEQREAVTAKIKAHLKFREPGIRFHQRKRGALGLREPARLLEH